ncbi:MAG: hypothetical protein HY074_01450, partial [Deltaproteobacteria bacterium]|nr:hypothetical protein [Deltaproteobacteria bacterium]
MATTIDKTYSRKYLAPNFDPTSVKEVTAAYRELSARGLSDVNALEKWILDCEELSSAIEDRYSRAHVASTVNTTDEAAEKAYMQLVEEILPLTETFGFELNKKLIALPLT